MPPKRRKFESTFPAARIKKIMQLDDDVGRVASSVPIVISRAVEIFLRAVLTRSSEYATMRNAKTLTVGHLKHCIEQEKQWDFLKDLTAKIPDVSVSEELQCAPKRGRKRHNSGSTSNKHIQKKSQKLSKDSKQGDDEDEGDENSDSDDEGSDNTSSPSSSHSSLPASSHPSLLQQQQIHPPVSSSSSTVSPLAAYAASLSQPSNSSTIAMKPSPLLAYASSLTRKPELSRTTKPETSASKGLGTLLKPSSAEDDYDV